MDRVVRGRAATIYFTFQVDGTDTDPSTDTATIGIVKADGTDLVPAGTATTNLDAPDAGRFAFTLTPAHTAELDNLTATWTVTHDSHQQTFDTFVEVAGGSLFTVADALADQDIARHSPTVDQLIAARTDAERALEQACGVAFVPRYAIETVSGRGSPELELGWPKVRTIRTASVDGTDLTAGELAEVALVPNGAWWSGSLWALGASNVVVGYEHGFEYPPAGVSRAAIRLAKHLLLPTPVDDRALRIDQDQGSYVMATPGMRGQRFGIPEVDAVVARYDFSALVA